MKWRLKRRQDPEIAPDEIFLDASNTPDFDRNRFEGRIEQPLSRQTFVGLASVLGLLFLVLIVRVGYLEIIHGAAFAAESANNSLEASIVFAPRGIITDVHGTVLAENIARDDGSMGRRYSLPEFGQIIGYVSYPKKDTSGVYYDTSMRGIAGLEAEYDRTLAGKNGQLLVETDALGHVRSHGVIVPAEPGETLVLSIDADLEKKFARAISDVVSERNFIAGAGVIMDVNNGALHAIVSYPSYDPNVMSNGSPSDIIAKYTTDRGQPFLDHAVQGAYTPGSIVKPFVASGALTDGLITPATTIDDPGFISLPDPYNPGKNFIYRSWKELGLMDVRKAIAWSSSVFFYAVGGGFGNQKGMGIDRLNYWYQQFGLGSITGIDLPGEVSGRITTPAWKRSVFNEPWYLGDTYFTAIGQYAMQVTPIQMVRATSAVANGGKLFIPTMLANATPSYRIVPVDAGALNIVREGMRFTVTDALAQAINMPYVEVAAKTGTAETGVRNQYINSWVEGFFPYDNPQYAFVVILERGPAGSGSQAVHVMARLFESLYVSNSPYVGGTGVTVSTTTP